MFENDEDIDVDDDFLNDVFENEERENNNKSQKPEKLVTDTKVVLNTPSAIIDSMKNQSAIHDLFIPSQNLSLNKRPIENHFPELSHINNNHQPGSSSVGNKENKRKQSSPPPPRLKRERKFPGPAGLLPDRKSAQGTPLKLDHLTEVKSPSPSTPDELCSQGRLSGSVLEEGPWQGLITDLGPHADILDIINVASVKRKAAARCFVGRKVPFLAAVLHHLEVSSADPCIILRDSTGEIHGTLHREVWQQFAAELLVGSVLVIRNVGLLSTGISSRRHYLNITANNLVTIYSANSDKAQKQELHSLTSKDYIRTIEQWRSLVAPPRTMASPASSLFNTSLSSSCSPSPAQHSVINITRPSVDGPRHPNAPYPSTVRSTSQSTQGQGSLFGMSSCPKSRAPPRPLGKNLFPSLINAKNPKPGCTLNNNINGNSPSGVRQPCGTSNQSNPMLSRNTANNTSLPHSLTKSNMQSTQIKKGPASNGFKFDSVCLKNKTSNNTVFPLNYSENQLPSTNHYRKECVDSSGKNSPQIVLSQSSQLTVEERSVVESVLDGIDADSLFDDDF